MNYNWLRSDTAARWRFDGDRYDDSENNYHLIYGGGPAGYKLGRFGQSIYFSGATGQTCGYYVAAYSDALKYQTFSLVAWIKATATGERTIISFNEYFDYSGAWGWALCLLDGVVRFYSANGDGNSNWSVTDGTKPVNDGAWHQIVLVRTPSTTKIFVDGLLDISGSSDDLDYPTTVSIAIAVGTNVCVDYGYYGDRFIGLIDDVIILSSALSAQSIYQMYAFQMGWI